MQVVIKTFNTLCYHAHSSRCNLCILKRSLSHTPRNHNKQWGTVEDIISNFSTLAKVIYSSFKMTSHFTLDLCTFVVRSALLRLGGHTVPQCMDAAMFWEQGCTAQTSCTYIILCVSWWSISWSSTMTLVFPGRGRLKLAPLTSLLPRKPHGHTSVM